MSQKVRRKIITEKEYESAVPAELRKELKNSYGHGCACHAHYYRDCVCNADWRSHKEVVFDYLVKHPKDDARKIIDAVDLWYQRQWR